MNTARLQAAALVILEEVGWRPGLPIDPKALFGDGEPAPAAAPTHAKTDGATVGRTAPTTPARVYVMAKGFDRKLANKLIGAKNGHGRVLAQLIDHKGGLSGPQIATRAKMNGKTVQSSAYHLRHMGLIETVANPAK